MTICYYVVYNNEREKVVGGDGKDWAVPAGFLVTGARGVWVKLPEREKRFCAIKHPLFFRSAGRKNVRSADVTKADGASQLGHKPSH